MPKICVAEPSEFQPTEIDDFVAFVLAGGEVEPNGLRGRVNRAPSIAFLREGACLLGVGGLKRPSENHRGKVATGAKAELPEQSYPFELGWVFILPSARGRKLSLPLCQPLVTAANGKGIFATSRVNNGGMHATLAKLGFVRTGAEWPSKQNIAFRSRIERANLPQEYETYAPSQVDLRSCGPQGLTELVRNACGRMRIHPQ